MRSLLFPFRLVKTVNLKLQSHYLTSFSMLAGWAFADSVLHRLAPLWVGARGLEFTWDYLLQGLEANANLVNLFSQLTEVTFLTDFCLHHAIFDLIMHKFQQDGK